MAMTKSIFLACYKDDMDTKIKQGKSLRYGVTHQITEAIQGIPTPGDVVTLEMEVDAEADKKKVRLIETTNNEQLTGCIAFTKNGTLFVNLRSGRWRPLHSKDVGLLAGIVFQPGFVRLTTPTTMPPEEGDDVEKFQGIDANIYLEEKSEAISMPPLEAEELETLTDHNC